MRHGAFADAGGELADEMEGRDPRHPGEDGDVQLLREIGADVGQDMVQGVRQGQGGGGLHEDSLHETERAVLTAVAPPST